MPVSRACRAREEVEFAIVEQRLDALPTRPRVFTPNLVCVGSARNAPRRCREIVQAARRSRSERVHVERGAIMRRISVARLRAFSGSLLVAQPDRRHDFRGVSAAMFSKRHVGSDVRVAASINSRSSRPAVPPEVMRDSATARYPATRASIDRALVVAARQQLQPRRSAPSAVRGSRAASHRVTVPPPSVRCADASRITKRSPRHTANGGVERQRYHLRFAGSMRVATSTAL